jgi:hypothetical protein
MRPAPSGHCLRDTMKKPHDMDKQMGMMQESMPKMLMIMNAKNPQERERLTQVYQQVTRKH